MSGTIGNLFEKNPKAKLLAILGNLHVLKDVEWLNPENTGRFLPSYLRETHPGLRVYSIVTENGDEPESENLTPRLSSESGRSYATDAVHVHHEISLLKLLDARRREACLFADGLIFCR